MTNRGGTAVLNTEMCRETKRFKCFWCIKMRAVMLQDFSMVSQSFTRNSLQIYLLYAAGIFAMSHLIHEVVLVFILL